MEKTQRVQIKKATRKGWPFFIQTPAGRFYPRQKIVSHNTYMPNAFP